MSLAWGVQWQCATARLICRCGNMHSCACKASTWPCQEQIYFGCCHLPETESGCCMPAPVSQLVLLKLSRSTRCWEHVAACGCARYLQWLLAETTTENRQHEQRDSVGHSWLSMTCKPGSRFTKVASDTDADAEVWQRQQEEAAALNAMCRRFRVMASWPSPHWMSCP